MYKRKTKDVYVLYGNYGYGYEELVNYEDFKEAKEDLKAYRENEPKYAFKVVKKRERV